MSWSASYTSVEKDAIGGLEPPDWVNQLDAAKESVEQFEVARAAAQHIASRIGEEGAPGKVNISMSGHANVGHINPTPGYADEQVTVSVSWAQQPAAEAETLPVSA